MSDPAEPNQEESAPPGNEKRPSWDLVLSEAQRRSESGEASVAGPQRESPARRYLPWVKALFPVLIIVGFIAYKAIDGGGGPRRSSAGSLDVTPAESLTGVDPKQDERLALDRETRTLIADLEAKIASGEWTAVRDTIAAHPNQAVREHPVVDAMQLLARARTAAPADRRERTAMVQALQSADGRLRPQEDRYAELIHEMRLAQVLLLIRDVEYQDAPFVDRILGLLGREARNTRDVDVRMAVSAAFESKADRLMTEADGILKDDLYKVREARGYFQAALRPIVLPDGWIRLEPVSQGTRPSVERIAEKLRTANYMIHGPALPFTGNDSTTWSGKKDTPVHDNPP